MKTMGVKSAWEGFKHYLTSTKDEIESEWDEFQEEIDKTDSYDQSLGSDILQQTSNGLSFAAEAVGSLVNNKSTRELASETIEEIAASQTYKEVSQGIDRGISFVAKETSEYLDAHPETKARLEEAKDVIDSTIDKGISEAQTFITKHDEALRNVGAVGGIIVAAVPLAKGAKVLNAVHKANKIDIDANALKFTEVRHSQNTISYYKKDRETGKVFSYDDIKESMSKEGWKGEAVDVIEMPDGKLTSMDNSRVRAAKEVGIDIRAKVRAYYEALSGEIVESERFIKRNGRDEIMENPTTWGEAVSNRIANQPAHFRAKEAGYGSHDLPRITGKPEDIEHHSLENYRWLDNREVMLIAGGVGTYIATDALGQMGLEELEQAQSHETQTPTTPKARTILTENNTTQAEDIIRADENTQPQSCSLLPAEMRYDNAQIAEFDVDEDENNLTDDELYNEFMDSHGYNIPFPDNNQSQETQADTLTKEQKTLQDLYPHLYQDKSDEDEMDDQNDYGMEM